MTDETELQHGEIEYFNGTSYGFIKPDTGENDIFFHVGQIMPKGQSVKRGDKVVFLAQPDIRKPSRKCAVQIKIHK